MGNSDESLANKYPKYYKPIPEGWKVIDVYGVHQLFPIDDPSGALRHASKKLLIPGTRTGGKSQYDDVKEARDTLNRWLELNKPTVKDMSNTVQFACTGCHGSGKDIYGRKCITCEQVKQIPIYHLKGCLCSLCNGTSV